MKMPEAQTEIQSHAPARESVDVERAECVLDQAVGASPEADDLAAEVYDALRSMARGFLARERRDHTLQPTALVHEAYVRLAGNSRVVWQGRTHFFAVGANIMRRLLIDHARRNRSPMHGGDWQRVTFEGALEVLPEIALAMDELLALNEAIDRLATLDPRASQVVELRFFTGLAMGEIAAHLGVSKRTIEDDWSHARAWLADAMGSSKAAKGSC